MPTAWIAQTTYERQGETFIDQTTTVYANNQIEATKAAQAALGTNDVTVQAIPDEYGGAVPSDQDIIAGWKEILAERVDENVSDDMRGASGQAYQ